MEGWQSLADCTGLENQRGFKSSGGSNPSPSTIKIIYIPILLLLKDRSNNKLI